MAKKKTKKNNQKQVETQPQPESLHTATTTTTEVPIESATSEPQQEPLTPPSKTTNDEDSMGGSVSLSDQTHAAIRDEPGQEETSKVANDASTTKSIELEDKDVITTVPIDEPAVSTVDAPDHVASEIEEIQSSVKETAETPQVVHSDASAAVPESVVPDVTDPSQSDAHVTADAEMAPPVVPLPSDVIGDTAAPDITIVVNPNGVESAEAVESGSGDPPPTEPVATQSEELVQHDEPPSVIQQEPAEDVLVLEAAPSVTLNEPTMHIAPTVSDVDQEVRTAVDEPVEEAKTIPAIAAEEASIRDNSTVSVPVKEQPSKTIHTKPVPAPLTSSTEEPVQVVLEPISMPEPPSKKQVDFDMEAPHPETNSFVPKETAKQRRRREAEEEIQREEQERLDQENFEQYRIDQERLEMARLEQKRLERERMRQERFEKERIEQEKLKIERAERKRVEQAKIEEARLEEERLEKERLERIEKERLEQERLEAERLKAQAIENERLERVKIEQDRLEKARIEQEQVERARLEQERLNKEEAERSRLEQQRLDAQRRQEEEEKEKTRLHNEKAERETIERQRLDEEARATTDALDIARRDAFRAETEAARNAQEQHAHPLSPTERAVGGVSGGPISSNSASPREQQQVYNNGMDARPAQLPTPRPEFPSQRPIASSEQRTSNPGSRLPTPTTSVGRGSSPRSATVGNPIPGASQSPSQTMSAHRSDAVDHISQSRHANVSPALPAPRPQAVSQIIEDSRPPAPSPPVGRLRPRHVTAFDSDDDDSDSALVRPRRQFRGGEEYPRDGSSGSGQGYQQPAHHRSVFASRVPAEPAYTNPPPPQPPNYHPGYYPTTAPPHYQNHNYRVSQPGYPHSNPYGPTSHSSSAPYTEPWNYPPGYRHDSPPQRHDTLVTRDYPSGLAPLDTRSGHPDDPGDVFSRIAQAIPDLHVLLARYKETHGQLSVREELLRRSSVEQEERLRVKDDEIADLKERARSLEHRYSSEASRLRFQIGNLEEQARELLEQRVETEKFKKEAQETKSALEDAMKSWESRYKELEEAHAALERTSADDKASFEEWKSTTTTRNDAEKIALAIHFDQRLKEADTLAENQRQEAAAAHDKEKEDLKSELETQLAIAQQDREDALRTERENRETWLAEREALIKSHQDELELSDVQYKKSRDESDKAWIELHADASRKAEEEKAKVDELIREKEELQKRYNALKAESEQEKAIIKSVASNLESEKSRLEKLMECYGDIAEIKSKGDTYYLVSFSQLQKQIIDLATTHFVHLPVRPPAEDLAQVPSNLPSFLGDTIASRQVRSAYVAHTVSKLITYRVFGPFLFSLGRRYDKADSLFSSMSHHIRDKSTRKEAIWRQQTLLAAFTSSGAKQRINTAAGTVVEEIVSAIKHFADPREEEGIKIAVKRIVKLAAETWRFARLERELINATMPALHDEEHQFTGPEYWPSYESYKPEGTLIGSLDGTSPPSDERPQLLLRLFPVIWREAKHENFHVNGEKPDEGCVLHHGLALYEDAEPVVQRMEELKSAGLPSHTTTSPTIAEDGKFPPPTVPPPREPLPNPPATAESSKRSSTHTVPSSPTEVTERTSSRKATPPPPPSSIPSLAESTPSMPVKAYQRPLPGPIDFASPRDLIGLPPPIESMIASSQAPTPKKTSEAPSTSAKAESVAKSASSKSRVPPPPPPSVPPPPPPVADAPEDSRAPTPAESAVIPASFGEPSPSEDKNRDLPTPPHSRSGTPTERPISPLFEAVDEIEALQPHRSRPSSKSLSRRRSTHSRRSKEEMPDVEPTTERQQTSRRTSGYALSTKSAKTADSERSEKTDRSEKSEKTERTEKSDRDPKSRYMCESRSAAVKALYPNSPMAQSSGTSTKGSVSSSKKKDRDSKEFKDRDSKDSKDRDSKDSKDRESKELRRERSIPDNGTWDTSSNLTSEVPNSQLSG